MIEIKLPDIERKEALADINKEAGLYFLYDHEGVLLYIGQSKNLRKRIAAKLVKMQEVKSFAVVYVQDPFDREIYETAFINEMKPSQNKSKVFYKG
jgi:excinuclease UvrABC nuclease subunit